MKMRFTPLTAAVAVLLSPPVFAQSETAKTDIAAGLVLPPVKVTADRQLIERDQVSSPTRVLERAALDSLPIKDVTEALATLPNVNVRRSGGQDGESSIGMYGISAQPRSSSSTTLAVDGVPLNNGVFPESSLNFLPLSLLSRIEVIQGPASSAYGNNARLGVLNLITRKPQTFGGEVSVAAGKWNTTDVGGYLGSGFSDGGNYLIGFDQRKTDGHLQPKGSADFSDSKMQNLAGFLNKRFEELSLSAAYINHQWSRDNPGYLVQPGTPAATNPIGMPTARNEDGSREHANVRAAYQFSPQWSGDLTYAYNDFEEKTRFDAKYGTPSGFGATAPTSQRATSSGLAAKGTWETDVNLLTFGVDHNKAKLENRVNALQYKGDTTGIFVQNRFLAFDKQLSILAGYRKDSFTFYDQKSNSPKLGFVWKPTGANWLVRGNVSRAFSAPSFDQLFGSFGNTKLIATTLTVRELGGEIRPLASLTLGATVFETKTTNPIYPRPRNQNPICAPGAGNCFVNVGDVVSTTGLTLDFRHQATKNWQWGGSWTHLNPGESTFATSANVIKLDTRYQTGQLLFSGTLRRETGRYFQDGHLSPFPDFTAVDLGATYRFSKSIELSAILENAGNAKYATTQIVSTSAAFSALPIYRPERNLMLRGTFKF